MNFFDVLTANRDNYENLYAAKSAFLRYPADWVIRFHNIRLREKLESTARILDYGCGSGNNSVFFMQQGYEVHGCDVAPSFQNLLAENLKLHNLPAECTKRFTLIDPEVTELPYPTEYFDFILSNQVLYYLPTEEHLKKVVAELHRILKPRGVVMFTMMGPANYYITHHTKSINAGVTDIRIDVPGHRLEGVRELIRVVRDEDHLRSLFDVFQTETVGHFEQSMYDMKSNFHWIFVGRK